MQELALTIWDYGLMALIVVILPVRGYFENKKMQAELAAGNRSVIPTAYKESMVGLWLIALLVLLVWGLFARPFSELGLVLDGSLPHVAAMVIALLATIAFALQVLQVRRKLDAAVKFLDRIAATPAVERILPQNDREYRFFAWLSVTAGITEEIIFRGYLIAVFAVFMPLWAAAAASLAIFTLAHLYQESAASLVRVMLIGATFTAIYLLSGSLVPAIILHAIVDLAAGILVWQARKTVATAA